MGFNIAIDGPAGAGKSTIAKLAASELSYIYVDTGAMYRAIGLYVYRKHVPEEDINAIGETAKETEVSIRYIDGEDVSEEIRNEHIGHMAAVVCAVPAVREHLLSLQRQIAQENDIIMDGRDIGTCILPNADVKIFLTASAEERARRRYLELQSKGDNTPYDVVLADIKERDYRDTHRDIAPLKQAEDAVYLDTSNMTIEEAAAKVVELAKAAR